MIPVVVVLAEVVLAEVVQVLAGFLLRRWCRIHRIRLSMPLAEAPTGTKYTLILFFFSLR